MHTELQAANTIESIAGVSTAEGQIIATSFALGDAENQNAIVGCNTWQQQQQQQILWPILKHESASEGNGK